jgi:hypothetical protein
MKQEDRLIAQVRESFSSFLSIEHSTKQMESVSESDPDLYVGLLLGLLRRQRRDIRYYLRRDCGIKVRYFGQLGLSFEQHVVSRKHYPDQRPRTKEEYERYVLFRSLTALMAWLDFMWGHMIAALYLSLQKGEEPAPAMLAAYYDCRRQGPLTEAPSTDLEPDETLREQAVAQVTGWAAAKIKRHEPLDDDFLWRLIPASLEAWSDMDPNEPMRSGSGRTNFISRVRASLRRFGRGERQRAHERKLLEKWQNSVTQGNDEIGEVEDREMARRKLTYVEELVERKGFLAPRQYEAYKLDRQLDCDTKAVADAMGTDEATVRQQRMRYRRKLDRACEAAGF